MIATFAAAVANIVNWGFGLIVGALPAKKVPRTDYRLLIISAYIGFMTWYGGLYGSGGIITNGFVNISNVHTFPIFTFLSSALINFFVPSGGGHRVAQGPFINYKIHYRF